MLFLFVFSPPGRGALSRADVDAVLKDPASYDGKTICVQGPAEDVEEKTSSQGNPYVLFQVRRGESRLKIFSFGRGVVPKEGAVTACGIFFKVKKVGDRAFHNELTAAFVGQLPSPGAPGAGVLGRILFQGQVTRVMDGDTVEVAANGQSRRVRFQGVDCPETSQAFGPQAREFTARRAIGETVAVTMTDIDKYGRIVGWVTLPDGTILNRELVRGGLAWWYRQYAPRNADLEKLETSARRGKKGLWQDASPMAPWEFRHRLEK